MSNESKQRIQSIIDNVDFESFKFYLIEKGDGFLLQLSTYAEEIGSGSTELVEQKSRKWYISAYSTETEVVETAFAAASRFIHHELCERFMYKGKQVYSPHFDINARLHVCEENRFDKRT